MPRTWMEICLTYIYTCKLDIKQCSKSYSPIHHFWACLWANTDRPAGPESPLVASSEYPHMCEVTAGMDMWSELGHLHA